MKKLIYLVLFVLLIASCNQDQPISDVLDNARISTTATGDYKYVATSGVDFQNALNEAIRIPIGIIEIGADTIKGNFTSNMKWKCKSRKIKIIGGAAIDGGIARIFPKDMSEAVNGSDNFYRYSIDIDNIMFIGSGSNGLSLNCMYSPSITNCQFEFKDTGAVLTFVLNADIRNNRFTNCKMSSLTAKTGVGTIPGAGLSTSASNNPRLIGNRIFNATGAKSGISLIACSGINIEDHISEGGTPDYHIFIDGLNNTTSWFRNLERIHIESRCNITAIYIAERQGFVHLADLFFQYPSNMVEVASQAGAITVVWDRIAYIPTASTIKSTGSTVRWTFNSVYPNINVTNTALWAGNKLPAVLNFNKLDGTGKVEETWLNGVKK